MKTLEQVLNLPYEKIAVLIAPHFLENEKLRRQAAIACFEGKDFNFLRINYGAYTLVKNHEYKLKNELLDKAIQELQSLKLPDTADAPTISTVVDFDTYEAEIVIEYRTYEIASESTCSRKAMHIARNFAWKARHQPNGIDGKKAIEIIKKYL